jgi:hypothetical protein
LHLVGGAQTDVVAVAKKINYTSRDVDLDADLAVLEREGRNHRVKRIGRLASHADERKDRHPKVTAHRVGCASNAASAWAIESRTMRACR